MTDFTRRQALATGSALAVATMLPRFARAAIPVRLTSVQFGSVSWLIDTIRFEKFDQKHGLDLHVVEVANNPAAPVALLSGAADVAVSDWTWALRQRAKGDDLKFAPYSSALGSLMVPKGSSAKSLADLKGKKIGVAGTGIDKSWILLRAYSRKVLGKDIATLGRTGFRRRASRHRRIPERSPRRGLEFLDVRGTSRSRRSTRCLDDGRCDKGPRRQPDAAARRLYLVGKIGSRKACSRRPSARGGQ